MPLISQVFLLSSVFILATSLSVQNAVAFAPTMSPSSGSSLSRISNDESSSSSISSSRLRVSSTFGMYDDDYVRNLEDKLIHFSTISDDDVRRNDFEAFVINRLQMEIAITNAATTTCGATLSSTVERLKLKSLNFVQAMDRSILKLGQSAQYQGLESHVTSGGNDIWPYVDMLIQFKLLISNMERTTNRGKNNNVVHAATTATTTAAAAAATTTGNGCKCKGCPGLNSCKDGKKKRMP